MLLPPPNVTGALHLGHALTLAIQDTIARYRRMMGDSVHWIPGTDHAGIATQTVFERRFPHLVSNKKNQEGRFSPDHMTSRQELQTHMEKFVSDQMIRIRDQIDRLGVSVDWGMNYFTLDSIRSQFVEDTFIRLFEMDLIYRQTRLINWCSQLKTAISDIEVDFVDVEQGSTLYTLPSNQRTVEVGLLHSIAYPCVNSQRGHEVLVMTTRLETMLGDVALAVHPDDERYRDLIGSHVVHPLLPSKTLPIVASRLVDRQFGSGVLKVTPAHDRVDYAIAEEHGLPMISIFDETGCLTDDCGVPFVGIDRFDARQLVKKILIDKGLYRGSKHHAMRLAVCSRTGDIIETLLRPQW
jgi:valyl-tRNA synthetase